MPPRVVLAGSGDGIVLVLAGEADDIVQGLNRYAAVEESLAILGVCGGAT